MGSILDVNTQLSPLHYFECGAGIRCSTDYAFDYAAARSQQLLLSSSTVHKFLDSVNPEYDVLCDSVCVPILVTRLGILYSKPQA